jgi:hypothetical protein
LLDINKTVPSSRLQRGLQEAMPKVSSRAILGQSEHHEPLVNSKARIIGSIHIVKHPMPVSKLLSRREKIYTLHLSI